MAWDEWEQLKNAAAERHATGMQLNHVPIDPVGDSGTLLSNRAAWSKAGRDVGALREDIIKALGDLSGGQKGLGEGAAA